MALDIDVFSSGHEGYERDRSRRDKIRQYSERQIRAGKAINILFTLQELLSLQQDFGKERRIVSPETETGLRDWIDQPGTQMLLTMARFSINGSDMPSSEILVTRYEQCIEDGLSCFPATER